MTNGTHRTHSSNGRPVEVMPPTGDSTAALWRRLTSGLDEPWLDEVGSMPIEGDDAETSLDIWTVALTAALKDPARRSIASRVLKRLSGLPGSARPT